MVDRDRARNILTRLRAGPVSRSCGRLRHGYSSLSYLCGLLIDELKLDRPFVSPMADDVRAAALVASTIDLAHTWACAWSPKASKASKASRTRSHTPR